jgi:methylisocitrate lyase
MLFAKKSAAEKRQSLRDDLASGRLLRFPGAHAPIVSRIAEETGFDGVYISGAALSADMALPDIGLTPFPRLRRAVARLPAPPICLPSSMPIPASAKA